LGTLIVDGTPSALTYPWLFYFAAGLLVLTVLAVFVLGDGLCDALNPDAGSTQKR
jgi:peptide/nickel transport system permease protein